MDFAGLFNIDKNITLPETKIASEHMPSQQDFFSFNFQSFILRGRVLMAGQAHTHDVPPPTNEALSRAY